MPSSRIRLAALSLGTAAVAACGEPGAPIVTLSMVRAHRASWSAHALTSYAYEYKSTGFFICCTHGQNIRLVVRNDTVVSAVIIATGQAVPGSPTQFPTIDALFDRAELQVVAGRLSAIAFDGLLDYPTRMDIGGPPDASGSLFAAHVEP